MAKINTLNYQTVASWNGSQDLFIVEQPDGTKVATPEQVKQYVLGDMDEVPTQNSNNPVKSGGIYSKIGDLTQTGLTGDSVSDQLSQLNDEIAKQAVIVTKTSAVTSNSGIVAYICNNFCFVTIDANILSGAVDGTVLATGFTKPIYFNAIGRTTKAFDVMINSSGELIIKGTPTTGWVQGSISYMI